MEKTEISNLFWEGVQNQVEARPPPAGVTGLPGAAEVVRETKHTVL